MVKNCFEASDGRLADTTESLGEERGRRTQEILYEQSRYFSRTHVTLTQVCTRDFAQTRASTSLPENAPKRLVVEVSGHLDLFEGFVVSSRLKALPSPRPCFDDVSDKDSSLVSWCSKMAYSTRHLYNKQHD